MNGKKAKQLRRGLKLTTVPRLVVDTPNGQRLVKGHPRAGYRAAKRMFADKVALRAFMEQVYKGGSK